MRPQLPGCRPLCKIEQNHTFLRFLGRLLPVSPPPIYNSQNLAMKFAQASLPLKKTLSDEMDSAPAAWRPRDGARLALHATCVEELRSGLRREYGAALLAVAAEGAGERFVSCRLPWKSITFEYCSYGAQARVAFPKIKQVRQQYCLRGAGQAELGGDEFPINRAET